MFRHITPVVIACLLPAISAYASGLPGLEAAKRCKLARSNADKSIYGPKAYAMRVSNEGKSCYINESFYQDGSGKFGNRSAYESFSLQTAPRHGTVTYSADLQSYTIYRPTQGYVGTDTFDYRLFPGNGLRTVTVTVGP